MIFKGKLDLINATFKKILNGPGFLGFAALAALCGFLFLGHGTAAQQMKFRVGEKLTYRVSLDKFDDVAFAETQVVSSGLLDGKPSFELRFRMRSLNFATAAFFLFDEDRTTFVSAETGLPLFQRRTDASAVIPIETTIDHRGDPAAPLDLVATIYRVRQLNGSANLTFSEGGRAHTLTSAVTGTEKLTLPAGEFDTNTASLQSEYFATLGMSDVRINLTADERQIPVLMRARTPRGELRVEISGIVTVEERTETPTPTPVIVQTPTPTPTPVPTPTPYQDNQPISRDLPFVLGETLRFRVREAGNDSGMLTVAVEERREFDGVDSLRIAARLSDVPASSSALRNSDSIVTFVDPGTIIPFKTEVRFSGALAAMSHTATLDRATNVVIHDGNRSEAPFATHSVLSLLYAARSFNLKPSSDSKNPVNDTRVSVFWRDRATVFVLRPGQAEALQNRGEQRPAQQITLIPQNPELDRLMPRLWLGLDAARTPLKFTLGNFEFDLIDIQFRLPAPPREPQRIDPTTN